jgi:tetratricopeptide (TPR) repeat protein
MDNHLVYKQLGSPDDKFAMQIANNQTVSPSLRVIAFCILHDYAHAKALYDTCTAPVGQPDEDVFWLEAQIMMNFRDNKQTDSLRKIAETAVSRAEWAIISRTFLGTVFETEKEFSKAVELYQAVLVLCPSNLVALGGLVRSYIQLKKNNEARATLKMVKNQKLFNKLEEPRKLYWQVTFLNYEFVVRRQGIAILVGLSTFIVAFLLPSVWIIPVLVAGLCLLSAYLLQMKSGVNIPTLKRLALSVVIIWLIVYVVRNVFNFVENIH